MANVLLVALCCAFVSAICINETVGHHTHDHDGLNATKLPETINGDKVVEEKFSNGTEAAGGNRNKRNTGASPENLLASCQLTNLLLYQALQQQRQVNVNPLLALASNFQGLGSNFQGLGSNLNLNSLPLGQGIAGGNLLNPLGVINQNLVYPSLHTYTTTSTFVTKMTTTALVTVPLLFGNKQFSTTILRTKVFDLTTSEVKTLTSTITPTLAAPQIKATPVASEEAVVVTPTNVVKLEAPLEKENKNEYDVYEDAEYQNDVPEEKFKPSNKKIYLRAAQQASEDRYVAPSKPTSKIRGTATFTSSVEKNVEKKPRRKARPTTPPPAENQQRYTPKEEAKKTQGRQSQYQANPQDYEDYYSYGQQQQSASGGRGDYRGAEKSKKKTKPAQVQEDQFFNRQYGSVRDEAAAGDEDPAAAQYPDDNDSYYARRLKRGEQATEEEDEEYTKLEREYLLEPSTDGDYSGNYKKYEKCPPISGNLPVTVTITSTEIRTITKFLKGQSSATPTPTLAQNNYYAATTSRGFTPTNSRRGSYKRNRDSDANASSRYDSTSERTRTPERTTRSSSGTTGDPRAQILRRGKSRYTPSPDYEYRG